MRHFSRILALVLIPTIAVHARQDKQPDYVKGLAGSWQSDKQKEDFLRFENTRLTSNGIFSGDMAVFHIKYEPEGKITLRNLGMKFEMTVTVSGDKLSLTDGSTSVTFHRVKGVPRELELKPFPMGKAANLAPDKLKGIQEELVRRRDLDQEVRTDGEKAKDMDKVDSDNTAYLKKLVTEVGWIDAKRFGKEIATAAFLIVQHSGDLLFMLGALPSIETDVKAKAGDPQDFALLYDRVRLMMGEKQRFGSQVKMAAGACAVYPLENRAKVEQFRKEIGLFPLAQYLEIFKEQSGATEVRFMDDWNE